MSIKRIKGKVWFETQRNKIRCSEHSEVTHAGSDPNSALIGKEPDQPLYRYWFSRLQQQFDPVDSEKRIFHRHFGFLDNGRVSLGFPRNGLA